MRDTHYISTDVLNLEQLLDIVKNNKKIALSDEAKLNIKKCRAYLDEKLKNQKEPVYGINTGFGSLYNIKISGEHLNKLQENLVVSHACGTGEKVPVEVVKLMLLLKVQSLSYGHSGVQLSTAQRLIDFFNNDILPVVYTQGSLGASGDLAPLAHLSLPLIGKGEVYFKGKIVAAEAMMHKMDWAPVQLQSKEGLALLNGTQFMSAYGVSQVIRAYKLSFLADLIGSISLEAYDGRKEPFDASIHLIRPHRGQVKTAERISGFLEGSELIVRKKKHVQDPYSFRCMPQVHGATKDTLNFVRKTFKTEINSVTDNPNIFLEEDKIISGGNFHGQTLALALDYLAISVAELGNISERRTYQLVSGLRELPAFLVNDPGLNSGLMIPQYTAASIVSQNKQLATPASVDSIVSSNGQEDHVSMGANAATKCLKVLDNVERILAIELINASQALVFREPAKTSPFLQEFLEAFREKVPFISQDRILHNDIVAATDFLQNYEINEEMLAD
ncbi:histidine ammonia-lyase [Sinomicrobium kalidii]|uniref:histidine ammonia-lyase n=1 Tax=Sinomicrobium kalidii TaxID=2900738 RepID=UPI001E497389|nr:histidine ammonia-lyase [Sinomicrobium kalidii]UGU16176.1 histidine ammonia-lyase [Sinomicrobium kalidii]